MNDTLDGLGKLMDDGKCCYLRIDNNGRFAVTGNILKKQGLTNGQNVQMDKFRAIIQAHEQELIELQQRLIKDLRT